MKTAPWPQLFRYEQKLTALAGADPSLTLLGTVGAPALLLAESARQDSWSGRLVLERVSLVRRVDQWSCRDLSEVALVGENGMWRAEDTTSHEAIFPPQPDAFAVVFISKHDFEQLQTFKNRQAAGPIFEFARRFFKTLPEASVPKEHPLRPGDQAALKDFEADLQQWIIHHRERWRRQQSGHG